MILMANLRGRVYDFKNTKLARDYHPAYLLRDPRQKAEAWKDLADGDETFGNGRSRRQEWLTHNSPERQTLRAIADTPHSHVSHGTVLRRRGRDLPWAQDPGVECILLSTSVAALVEVVAVLYIRLSLVPKAEQVLQTDSENKPALMSLRKWYVICFALTSESHFMDLCCASWARHGQQAGLFYVVGFVLILLCSPRKPI